MLRCPWATTEPNITYHDEEWGVPVHDDRKLFEFLILEGAQAGLSWTTILRKRKNYRKAFDSSSASAKSSSSSILPARLRESKTQTASDRRGQARPILHHDR